MSSADKKMSRNEPPHAANTVTIGTSQITRANIRPIPVPLRPQAVPIRKINEASTSSLSSSIKEEPHEFDQPAGPSTQTTAITTSNSVVGPSTSINTFQQYQRGATVPAPNQITAMDQPAPVNLASKVAEVFLTAGHAFQKLGDLTLQLHTTTDSEESKWSDKEVDGLRDSLTRFAHELDQISTCVANRTQRHIKTDIKRRHFLDEPHQPIKRMAVPSSSGAPTTLLSGSIGGGAYGGLGSSLSSSIHTLPLPKRVAMQPTPKIVPARTLIPSRYTVGQSLPTSSSSSSSQMPHLQQQAPATSAGRPSISTRSGQILTTSRPLPQKPSSGALVLESHPSDDLE